MSLKNIDIFQWNVSDIFAHHQWLKYKHPEDLTKYSFNSIPAFFLLILAYHDIQTFLSPTSAHQFGGYINRHKTIQRTSQSTQCMLCGHEKPSWTSIICDYHQSFVYLALLHQSHCVITPVRGNKTDYSNMFYPSHWKQRSPFWQLCTLSCHYDNIVKLKVF